MVESVSVRDDVRVSLPHSPALAVFHSLSVPAYGSPSYSYQVGSLSGTVEISSVELDSRCSLVFFYPTYSGTFLCKCFAYFLSDIHSIKSPLPYLRIIPHKLILLFYTRIICLLSDYYHLKDYSFLFRNKFQFCQLNTSVVDGETCVLTCRFVTPEINALYWYVAFICVFVSGIVECFVSLHRHFVTMKCFIIFASSYQQRSSL